jgi:hypothetical protein
MIDETYEFSTQIILPRPAIHDNEAVVKSQLDDMPIIVKTLDVMPTDLTLFEENEIISLPATEIDSRALAVFPDWNRARTMFTCAEAVIPPGTVAAPSFNAGHMDILEAAGFTVDRTSAQRGSASYIVQEPGFVFVTYQNTRYANGEFAFRINGRHLLQWERLITVTRHPTISANPILPIALDTAPTTTTQELL